jgi:hypothetical protein
MNEAIDCCCQFYLIVPYSWLRESKCVSVQQLLNAVIVCLVAKCCRRETFASKAAWRNCKISICHLVSSRICSALPRSNFFLQYSELRIHAIRVTNSLSFIGHVWCTSKNWRKSYDVMPNLAGCDQNCVSRISFVAVFSVQKMDIMADCDDEPHPSPASGRRTCRFHSQF